MGTSEAHFERRPLRAAYISSVDMPGNPRAHVVQMLKNAQALSRLTTDFEFLTNVRRSNWSLATPERLSREYGLHHPFPVHVYPLQRLSRSRLRLLRRAFFRLAAGRCARRGVELAYVRSNAAVAPLLARGIPTVVEAHSAPKETREKRALYDCLEHPLLLAMVTISEPLKRRYVEFGLPGEKILVLPDGVDLERFISPLDPEQARIALGLDPNRPLVVYVGHLYDGRGIEDILTVAGENGDAGFLLVGGLPEDVERWRERVRELGLANVSLTGHVDNGMVPTYLWAADILLMPYGKGCASTEWMSPMKMFEYMAAGRAVISTRWPSLETILRHDENCRLCPPDDGVALGTAVTELLAEPATRSRLGRQACEDVQGYSWVRRIDTLLRWLEDRGLLN